MRSLVYIALVGASLLPMTAAAQFGYASAERRTPQKMRVIQNDARDYHRRQSAKCMNAYPEDHGDYMRCVKGGQTEMRATAPQRRYYMPMPAAYRD